MTMGYLRQDLERLYYFEGQPDRKASSGAVWRRALTPRFLPVILCRLPPSRQSLTILAQRLCQRTIYEYTHQFYVRNRHYRENTGV